MDFKDKCVLVTGGIGGIGSAVCERFLAQGAKVVCADISVTKWQQESENMHFAPVDVASEQSVMELFTALASTLGRLDILVNNAGISKPKPFLELAKVDWDKVIAVNLTGVFLCSRGAVKLMAKQTSGKIINVSSFRGLAHCSNSGNIHYAVSKAGVISLTKGLAKELAPTITVNAVAPCYVDTPMLANWTKERRDCEIKNTPIGRLLKPQEIADAVLFLASDQASAITGEVLVVDGGYSIL